MKIPYYKYIWTIRTIFRIPFFGHIGRKTYIGKPCSLYGTRRIFIGNKVRIQPGVRLETHQNGKIIINNNVSIGQNFHCTSAGNLIIGKNCTILGNSFITNIDHEYKELDVHILNQKMILSETYIGDNCFIGFGAAIQAGTILGKQCIVGANSVVRGKFPDYCVIAGVPAKVIKKYNPISGVWEKVDNENR